MTLHARIGEVTERIVRRSRDDRQRYLDRMEAMIERGPRRVKLGCANLAHGFAACAPGDKAALAGDEVPNLAIVTPTTTCSRPISPTSAFRI